MQPAQGAGRAFTVLLALAAGVALTFLALPLVALFTQVPLGRVPSLLVDPAVRDALAVTLRTNAIANALIVLVGTPVGYLLATRRFRLRPIAITLVELPLVLPPAVAGIGLLAAFGAGGLLGGPRRDAGIVLPFTQWAVVLAVTFVASPFYVRQAITAFEAVDPALVDAALTLGVYEQLDANFDLALSIGILLVVLSGSVLVSYKILSSWRRSSSTSPAPFARTSSISA